MFASLPILGRRQRLSVFLVVFTTGLGIVEASYARTWNVHQDGSGDAPTIRAAADSSATGDSILVHPGTYEENVGLTPGTTIIGVGGPSVTTIDAAAIGNTLSGTDAIIEGLTLTGAISDGYGYGGYDLVCGGTTTVEDCALDPGGRFGGGGNLTVRECVFQGGIIFGTGCSSPGRLLVEQCLFDGALGDVMVQLHGGSEWSPQDVTLRDNVFHQCRGFEGAIIGWAELDLEPIKGLDLLVEDNLFVECEARAIVGAVAFGIPGPGSIRGDFGYTAHVVLRRNTFARNTGTAIRLPSGGLAEASTLFLESNIFSRNEKGASLGDLGFTYIVTCNNSWENEVNWEGIPDPTGLNGNFSAAPLFCAGDLEDFSLAENSPCLPANSPCATQVGAFGQGCGPVSVQMESWARILSRYR
jgi:hypothetical protein